MGRGSGNLPGTALAQAAAAELSHPTPGSPEHPGPVPCHAPCTLCPRPQEVTGLARLWDGHPLGHNNPPAPGRAVPGRAIQRQEPPQWLRHHHRGFSMASAAQNDSLLLREERCFRGGSITPWQEVGFAHDSITGPICGMPAPGSVAAGGGCSGGCSRGCSPAFWSVVSSLAFFFFPSKAPARSRG